MRLPQPDDTFAGEYVIQGELGTGGFAVVYRAMWRGQTVALKVLRPVDGAYSLEVVARFNREAGILSELRHPNIPRVFEHGRTAEGLLFIASEFVPGEELRRYIRRGPVGEELTLHVVREVLYALAEAHARGLLHRDIKPDNILLTPVREGLPRVTLLDFGIARHADPERDGRLTKTGALIGTPRYMSPEQLMARPLQPASDLYSLAMVGAELLGGADALHGGAIEEQVGRIAGALSVSLPTTQGPLAEVLRWMLTVDASARPQSAAAVFAALDRELASTTKVVARRRSRGPVVVFAVLVMLVIVAVVGFGGGPDESPVPPPPKRVTNPLASNPLEEPPPPVVVDVGPDVTTYANELPPIASGEMCDDKLDLAVGLHMGVVPAAPGLLRNTANVFYYLPQHYDPKRAHPTVMVFHDAFPDAAKEVLGRSGFQELADLHHVVVLLVDDNDLGTPWTLKRQVAIKNAFEHVRSRVCMDPERVFAVGNGRGGRAAMYTPCLVGARAIATNAWRADVMGGGDPADCFERVPYMHLVGLLDPDMPPAGGDRCTSGRLAPLAAHHRYWNKHLECSGAQRPWSRDERCTTWTCEKAYVSCEFDAGRSWGVPLKCSGGGPPTSGLAELMWAFFESLD